MRGFQFNADRESPLADAVNTTSSSGLLCYQPTRPTQLKGLDCDLLIPGGSYNIAAWPVVSGIPCRCIINWLLSSDKFGPIETTWANASNCVHRMLARTGANSYRKVLVGGPAQPWMACIFLDPGKSQLHAYYDAAIRVAQHAFVQERRASTGSGLAGEIRELLGRLHNDAQGGEGPHILDRYGRTLLQATTSFLTNYSSAGYMASIHLFQLGASRDSGPALEMERLREWNYHVPIRNQPEIEDMWLVGISDAPFYGLRRGVESSLLQQQLATFQPGLHNSVANSMGEVAVLTCHAAVFGESFYFDDAAPAQIARIAAVPNCSFVKDFYYLSRIDRPTQPTPSGSARHVSDPGNSLSGKRYTNVVIPLVDLDDSFCLGAINIEGYIGDVPLEAMRVMGAQFLASHGATAIHDLRLEYFRDRRVRIAAPPSIKTTISGGPAETTLVGATHTVARAFGADCVLFTLKSVGSKSRFPIANSADYFRDSSKGPLAEFARKIAHPTWNNERGSAVGALLEAILLAGSTGLSMCNVAAGHTAWLRLVARELEYMQDYVPGDISLLSWTSGNTAPDAGAVASLLTNVGIEHAEALSRLSHSMITLPQYKGLLLIPIRLAYECMPDRAVLHSGKGEYCAGVVALWRESSWQPVLEHPGRLQVLGVAVERIMQQQRLREHAYLGTDTRQISHDNVFSDDIIASAIDRTGCSNLLKAASKGALEREATFLENVFVHFQALARQYGDYRPISLSCHEADARLLANVVWSLTHAEEEGSTPAWLERILGAAGMHGIGLSRIWPDRRYRDFLPLFMAMRNLATNIKNWQHSCRLDSVTPDTMLDSLDVRIGETKSGECTIACANALADWAWALNRCQLNWFPLGEPGEGRYSIYRRLYSAYDNVDVCEVLDTVNSRRMRITTLFIQNHNVGV